MTEVLIAEDDAEIREWVGIALEGTGRRVRTAPDGAAALQAYAEKRPDLMILDVMMPKVSGWDVLAEIRRRDRRLPILMLTAKSAEADKVMGLDGGADDYLTKPFSLAELRARVAALLRRSSVQASIAPAAGEVFAFGDSRVDMRRAVVIAPDGRETELTALEAGILRFLAAHPDETVTREALIDALWGGVAYTGTNRTIDTRLARLRAKLGSDGAHIATVYGSGYRYQKPALWKTQDRRI